MVKHALKATVANAVLSLGLALPSLSLAGSASAPTLPPPSPYLLAATPVAATATTVAPPPGASVTVTTVTAPAGAVPLPAAPPSPLTQSPATPKIVQDAVAGLQKTDPINLDDMIRAQDAINRLDLLLEIEKRQTELKKLRDERDKPQMMASGIPASALNLPPIHSVPMPHPIGGEEIKPSGGGYSLKRIVGGEGHYSAVISTGGDKVVSVHAGESLPDGSKVKAVSLTSVSLVKDHKSKTLTIPSDSYIVRGSEAVTE